MKQNIQIEGTGYKGAVTIGDLERFTRNVRTLGGNEGDAVEAVVKFGGKLKAVSVRFDTEGLGRNGTGNIQQVAGGHLIPGASKE